MYSNSDIEASLKIFMWPYEQLEETRSLKNRKAANNKDNFYLIDTRFSLNHPLLQHLSIRIFNDETNINHDVQPHGTQILGILTRYFPRSKYYCYPLDIQSDDSLQKTMKRLLNVFHQISQLSPGTVVLPFGFYVTTSSLSIKDQQMINQLNEITGSLTSSGFKLFASIGNDHKHLQSHTAVRIPTMLKGVIPISATSRGGRPASYVNYGIESLPAPGGDVFDEKNLPTGKNYCLTIYPLDEDNQQEQWGIPQGYILDIGSSLSVAFASIIY